MGLFDNIFGGGNRERTRDESSVQADINRGLKESGGKFTPEINSLVAERERARSGGASSGGLGSLSAGLGRAVDTVRSIPGNFARDVRMGTSANVFANRDKQAENLASKGYSQREIQDYFARTDATIARDAAQEAARQNEGPSDAEMAAVRMGAEDIPPEDQMPRYRNPFGESALTVMPPPGEVTPDMRREALRIFESQRGAGQIPYQMLPYQQGLGSMPRPRFMPQGGMQQQMNERMRQLSMMRQPMSRVPDQYDGMRSTGFGNQMLQQPRTFPMPQPPMQQNPNVSPAFQYAAQNYQRLGGAQRLMDRPMEMMSVAERQRINEMAQGMADSQSRRRWADSADLEQIMRGKGGGNPAIPFSQRPTFIPGKGGDRQQSETINRILPFISQMGLASLRGPGMPPPVQGRPER